MQDDTNEKRVGKGKKRRAEDEGDHPVAGNGMKVQRPSKSAGRKGTGVERM